MAGWWGKWRTMRVKIILNNLRQNGGHSSGPDQEMLDLNPLQCVYCGQVCVGSGGRRRGLLRITVDHLMPQSFNGPNSFWNLVPACERCNHKRGCRDPRIFARSCPTDAPIHRVLQIQQCAWLVQRAYGLLKGVAN